MIKETGTGRYLSVASFRGLSTDIKPTNVDNGAEFLEIDTGDIYLFNEANHTWVKCAMYKPTDAQAEEYIGAWLDDHPEATTTVEDGAITTAKLADGAVTDAKLAQSGGVLGEVADLKSALTVLDGNNHLLTIANGSPTNTGNTNYVRSTNAVQITLGDEISIITDRPPASGYHYVYGFYGYKSDGSTLALQKPIYSAQKDNSFKAIYSEIKSVKISIGEASDSDNTIHAIRATNFSGYNVYLNVKNADNVIIEIDNLHNADDYVTAMANELIMTPINYFDKTNIFRDIARSTASDSTFYTQSSANSGDYFINYQKIPIDNGDIIRATKAINFYFYDSNDDFVGWYGNITDGGSYTVADMQDVAYLTFGGKKNDDYLSQVVVTINKPLPTEYVPFGKYSSAFLENRKSGIRKTIVVDANGNGDYSTIQSAVDNASDGDEVIIMPGTYEEAVNTGAKYIYLHGLGANVTKLVNHSGDYNTPPLWMCKGIVEGITIFAEKTEAVTVDRYGYALHLDQHWGTDITKRSLLLKDCIIKSDFSAPIGCGVIDYCNITIENCSVISTGETSSNTSAFQIHGDSTGSDNSTFVLSNSIFKSPTTGSANGILFSNGGTEYNTGTEFDLRVNNCTITKFYNNCGELLTINDMSYGNNIDELNVAATY